MVTKTEKIKSAGCFLSRRGLNSVLICTKDTDFTLVIGGHEKIISCTTVRVDEKAMRNRSGIH